MKATHKTMAKPLSAVTKALRNCPKPHLKLPQGYVAFRLLCHYQAGYAVIGIGGSMAVSITKETGISVLRVEDTLPGCDERIIYIVGPSHLDRTLVLQQEQQYSNNGGGEMKFQVSATQAALIRVLQIVETTSVTEGLLHCRLLAVKGQEKIKSLKQVVGASVRVLPVEDLPLCADLSDDLIQISGDTLAVRKALLAVTYHLQGNTSRAISQFHGSVASGVSLDMHAQKHQILDTDARDGGQNPIGLGTKKVAFRLLCSMCAAGGLIGSGGSIIKALEKETGARILVSDPVMGDTELVINVSAMEKKEWQNSPAQDATLRAFTRLMEAALESGSSGGESVTARLLIPSSQASVLDTIDNAGTEVQILENDCSAVASVDDKIIQIVGEYSDVHICLLQVTWTIRENIFTSKKKETILLPHELYGRSPHVNAATTIADGMVNIKLSCDMDTSLPTVSSSESSFGCARTKFMESQGDVIESSSSSELGSSYSSCPDLSGDEFTVIKNEELEIVVPAHVFGHVYGEGGGNLAILRQISGATVIVHDPCPGTDGKVIICGTPNQTMAAKSMLYAFIMSRHDCVIIK